MDIIFNTNQFKLLLAIITDIINIESSFLAIQLFIKSKSQPD